MFMKVIVTYTDVLGMWKEPWQSFKFKCTRVVLKDLAVYKGLHVYNFNFMLSHFLNKFHEKNDITGGHRHGYVLCIRSREHNLWLQLGGPTNGAGCVEYNQATPGLCSTRVSSCESHCGLLVPVARKIIITVALEVYERIQLEGYFTI